MTTSQNAQTDAQLTITGTDGRVELRPAFHGTATLRVARGDVSAEITTGYDGRHGLADLRTIRAIHEAAERGEVVDVADGL